MTKDVEKILNILTEESLFLGLHSEHINIREEKRRTEKIIEKKKELIKIYEDVQNDFEMAKHNAESFRTSADILSARLDKVYTFLEGKGYKVSEINEIMRLDSERG